MQQSSWPRCSLCLNLRGERAAVAFWRKRDNGFGVAAAMENVSRFAAMSVGRTVSFEPWRDRVESVAIGGDRDAINEVLESDSELGWLSARAIPRFFHRPGTAPACARAAALRLYSAELITNLRRFDARSATGSTLDHIPGEPSEESGGAQGLFSFCASGAHPGFEASLLLVSVTRTGAKSVG